MQQCGVHRADIQIFVGKKELIYNLNYSCNTNVSVHVLVIPNIERDLLTLFVNFYNSFFLEKNMQSFFLKVLTQDCGRYVCVQLLQTLNILFENIRNETSICKCEAM